ncbi:MULTISPECIES: hypothetical protein [unclassified Bacillus (in: firmicutes)]|uniref:hypothetical protein n=1 Tax=unclassified Bacillus (in: firmicutes) TaxID=185979 RepID=UPI0008E8681F|nr:MULTISPECIES: hypothetical protein [unclassified Bacillus (in: firmicutes)]SFA73695.1 hypothetical protein SAMN02799634_101389 [Bacillus sp. UNCCL13]SFQ63893.1 hypothetical protein SAMN04488577_0668 [Bacillus sp. cl95]
MNIFLLVISLLLNGIAIFLIFILYARQNRLVQVEKKQETIIRELEDTMTSYLVEMKEENEKFIEKLSKQRLGTSGKSQNVIQKDTNSSDIIATYVPKTSNENIGVRTATVHVTPNKAKAVSAYQSQTKIQDQQDAEEVLSLIDYSEQPTQERNHKTQDLMVENSPEDWKQKSLLSQALLLEAEGLTEDQIAKKLNKGTTEIHLLLKFNRKKEE